MVPPLQLSTSVPGLDDVLGGGLPERSCTAIVGDPGTGKTTLAQHILFTSAASGRCGVYFAGPGESPSKVLSHQQQLSFFDTGQLDHAVYLRRLSHSVVEGDPATVLAAIAHQIEARQADLVVVDLVQALTPTTRWKDLVFYLARCPITSILIADCEALDTPPSALLSAAASGCVHSWTMSSSCAGWNARGAWSTS
jgi:RecA/RadA recombinase